MLESFLPVFIVLGSGVLLLYWFLYKKGLLRPLWQEFVQRPALLQAWQTSAGITALSFLVLSILVITDDELNYNRFFPAYTFFLVSACLWSVVHLIWQSSWPPLENICLALTAIASLYMYWVASVCSTSIQLCTVPIVVHHVFFDFIVSSYAPF